uniref:GDSL esterase/lipase 6-like n=1 Tax=Erigeron canadensis TaxID=72917 RepID=UPI001CB92A3E|nr:GDSL esterase/lipase 6-like [Erigeron canadensis]
MTGRFPHLILFLAAFLAALALANAYHVKPGIAHHVKSIFVFGDSQFDAGNNKYIKHCGLQANYTPYGMSYFHTPTGRFTNGRTVADFISQYLGIKFQKPYQEVYRKLVHHSHHIRKTMPDNGLNFASAGSGLLPDTNNRQRVTSIQSQLLQFQALVKQNFIHRKQVVESIYFLASGSNDIFSYYLLHGELKLNETAYAHAMLKEASKFIDKIYKLGGRRIVAYGVGPMGCIPGRVLIKRAPKDHCYDKMDRMVKYYNAELQHLMISIPRRYPGAIGVYVVVYPTVQNFLTHPKLYGFLNVSQACCGAGPLNGELQCGLRGYKLCHNPNDYFFWDYFHPSERVYGLIAKGIWAGGKKQIWPMNVRTLASIKLPFH